MKNKQSWSESRVIFRNNRYRANINHVSASSYYLIEMLLAEFLPILQRYSDGLALDCGCGKVPYYGIYSKKISDVICVDWQNSEHTNPYVDYFVDLGKDKLPFGNDFFDTIYLNDVLEHIFDPFHLLFELKRVLKKDGHLIITVPFLYQIHEQPFDYLRYTEFFFSKWAQHNAMKCVELKAYGGRFDVFVDNVFKFMYQKLKISKSFIKITTPFLLSSPLRKYINKTGNIHFPIGYCVVLKKTG